jgi:hypothetical protein
MSKSTSNNNTSNTEAFAKAVAQKKLSRSWLAVLGIATVVGMALIIALSNIAPSPRIGYYLFHRQLTFKGHSGGPGETCSGGDECQGKCNLVACENQANALDCGCDTTAKCWNEDCQAQCSQDYICESEACQAACNDKDEEKACGCTEPQPTCFKSACADWCREDPRCGEDNDCTSACLTPLKALACGCGIKDLCFNGSCLKQCEADPLCRTQACQDTCVTTENTIACGCGCIKPECGHQCDKDSFCTTIDCQQACGSLGMEEVCGCALLVDRPTESPTDRPTITPTEHSKVAPTQHPTDRPQVGLTGHPTVAPTQHPTVAPTQHPTVAPTQHPTVAPPQHPTVASTQHPTDRPQVGLTGHPTVTPTPFSFKGDLKSNTIAYLENKVAWAESICDMVMPCASYYG